MDAVMARRRRSRIHATEAAHRRRRSRIHATEAAHRRRRSSSSSAPLDSLPDDMLEAILLRLPRQPSSRPRASAVSRRWRGIVTNPTFHRRFHAHHQKPPVLGVFERRRKFIFTPVLAAPDRIPAERLSISRWMTSRSCDVTACRHGRVLAIHRLFAHVVVFAPLSGEERNLPVVPDEFRECNYHHGAVLCAASGQEDHLHGFCHESPFKVALASRYPTRNRFITSVYSSESGTWGGLKEIEAPFKVALVDVPATLVGNVLCWMLSSNDVCAAMLEFDLDRQSLAVIKGPSHMNYSGSHRIIKTEQGTVGWVRFSFPILEIWLRQKNCHGLATWLQHKTVDMHDILGIPPRVSKNRWHQKILAYEEDSNVIILYVDDSAYMLDLNSMKSTKLDESRLMNSCHPFTSFYPPDMVI